MVELLATIQTLVHSLRFRSAWACSTFFYRILPRKYVRCPYSAVHYKLITVPQLKFWVRINYRCFLIELSSASTKFKYVLKTLTL